MPFDFQCQHCHRLLRAPDGSSGKQCQCPECGKVTLIIKSKSIDPGTTNRPLKTRCPSCNQKLEYTESLIGTRGLCKNCQFIFTLPPPGERSAPTAEAETFPFSCPKCKQLFEGRNEMEGRKGKCHNCQAMFIIRRKRESAESPVIDFEPPTQRLGSVVDFRSVDALAAGIDFEQQFRVDPTATTLPTSSVGRPNDSTSTDEAEKPTVVADQKVVAEVTEDQKATTDQKFDFNCSTCSTLLRASISHVGEPIRCPNCLVVMEIPRFENEDTAEFLDLQVEVIADSDRLPHATPAQHVRNQATHRLPLSFGPQQVADQDDDDESWRSLPRVNRTTSRAISPLKTSPLLGGSNHVKIGPIQPVTPAEMFHYVASIYPSTFFHYWLPLGIQASILIASIFFGIVASFFLASVVDPIYETIAVRVLIAIPVLVGSVLLVASVCRFTSDLVSSRKPSLRQFVPSFGQVGATAVIVILGVVVMIAAQLAMTLLEGFLPESLQAFSTGITIISGFALSLPILLCLNLFCIAIGSGESVALAAKYASGVIRSNLPCTFAILGLSFLLMACMVLVLCLLILLLPIQYVVLINFALLALATAVAFPLVLQLQGSLYFLARHFEAPVT